MLQDSLRDIFKGGTIVFLGIILEMGISFLGKVLVARELSLSNFGGISLGITISTILGTLSIFGLHTAIARYLPRDESQEHSRSILLTALSAGMLSATAIGLLVIVSAPYLSEEIFNSPSISPILQIFGAIIPLAGLNRMTTGAIQGNKQTVPKVMIEHISRPLTRITALGVVLIISASATGIAWAYFASWLLPTILCIRYFVKNTPLLEREISVSFRYRELLSFSVPLVFGNSMAFILDDIDKVLLGALSGTSNVAIYEVVYTMATVMTIGLTAFNFVFAPMISEFHSNERYTEIRRTYQVVTKWVIMATLPIFLVLFFFPVMSITIPFGGEYAAGATTLSVLALGVFFHTSMGLNTATLTSTGHTRLVMYITAMTAVVNFGLNVLLIPHLGYLGAGVATTVAFIFQNGIYSALLYRKYEIVPITESLIRPVLIALGLVTMIYAIVRFWFSITIPILMAFFLVFIGLYTVTILRFGGIEEEEVMIVKSAEERLGIDLGPIKRIAHQFM